MADVARGVNSGTGINVLVDPGATGDMQIVKLAYGAAGTETHIGADANGLDVDVVRMVPAKSATATLSNVNDNNANTSILASNSSRLGVLLHNDSTEILYLKYGSTATTTSYSVKIQPGGYWEMPEPIFTGALDGIWAANGSGAVRVTELT